jgi:hypothetical protein
MLAIRPGAMQQFQAVRLDLEKIFVANQFFRRRGIGRKRHAHFRSGFGFLSKSCTGA